MGHMCTPDFSLPCHLGGSCTEAAFRKGENGQRNVAHNFGAFMNCVYNSLKLRNMDLSTDNNYRKRLTTVPDTKERPAYLKQDIAVRKTQQSPQKHANAGVEYNEKSPMLSSL
jgi:hypothetical protein